ncbi:MAG: hypothetical protein L6R40_006200 [Gallowayella cf. fulva]|nr:MAG: hypothetical protein L6R40_006200 [Xanthomendoza cf. fulva]
MPARHPLPRPRPRPLLAPPSPVVPPLSPYWMPLNGSSGSISPVSILARMILANRENNSSTPSPV